MNQNTEAIIRFEKIHKQYGDFTAIKEINLEVAKGELFGFLGPNGAGKTTMIRMLTGIICIQKLVYSNLNPQRICC